MASKAIRVAFLGGAVNSAAGSAHYTAIRLINDFELVAGCFSRHDDINKESGRQYNVEDDRVYDSFDQMLLREKDKLDAIILLTPTDQHAGQVIRCLENGIPVICEKALACDAKEAEQINNTLVSTNGFLVVIYNYLGYPVLRELRNLIQKGTLGRIHHIQVEMPQEGFRRVDSNKQPVIPQAWRLVDKTVPTISLDLAVHMHMMIKFLTGELPQKVTAFSNSYGNFSTIKDNVSCMIEYSNDISCNMWCSKIAIGNRNGLGIRIYGEAGGAEWVQEDPEYLSLADNSGYRWKIDRGSPGMEICNQQRYSRFKAGHPAGFVEALGNYYYDIAESIRLYKNDPVNYLNGNCFGISESLEGLNLLEAMTRSSASGNWEIVA